MNSFWDWAVEAYGRDGVAEACLDLQDRHGQNVPLLLWAAWAAARGVRLDADHAVEGAAVARQWSEAAVVPLRMLRRRLKAAVSEGDEDGRLSLRERVKAVELEAERVLMAQLEPLTPEAGGEAVVLGNLLNVAAAWSSQTPHDDLRRLCEALTKG